MKDRSNILSNNQDPVNDIVSATNAIFETHVAANAIITIPRG